MTIDRKYLIDLAERVAATAAEAGLAYLIVVVTAIPKWWAVPLTTALAGLKGWIARHVGSPASASLAEPVK